VRTHASVSLKKEFSKPSVEQWEQLYEIAKNQPEPTPPITIPSEWDKDIENENAPVAEKEPYQLQQKYVLSAIKSGFILIEQQAAHERIIYEQVLHALNANKSYTQKQLFPQTIHLPPSDVALLNELLPEVQALGFDIQPF